ncbi:MAG: dTMP kinase [Candidatus Paceibacterota bacterium]
MNNYRGYFIVFEGLDGSGQTTQGKRLVDFLEDRNLQAIFTQNPTTTDMDQYSKYAPRIESILNGDEEVSHRELQSLFIKDRKWHIENVIKPALNEDKHVVCDRYMFSTIAYGAANGVDEDYLVRKQEDFLKPDLTILLEVSPEVCAKRIKERGDDITIFEKEEKLKNVWEVYEKLADEYDMERVDGTSDVSTKEKSIKEVSRRVQSVVMKELRI